MARCLLCTSNDREALAEQLAERMWESRRDSAIDGPWDKAGNHWQGVMRHFAQQTLAMLHPTDR